MWVRAGDPDLCLTELVDTAPQSADGTGQKNREPDQEALCGDGDAVNRQRILTIAATWNLDPKGRGHSTLAELLPSER